MFGKVFKGGPSHVCTSRLNAGLHLSQTVSTAAAGAYQDMVVAVKVAEVSVPRARAKAHLTEVHIAGTLRHPNVVSMLSMCCLAC